MKKLFFIFLMSFTWGAAFSQPFSLFSYEGEVHLVDKDGQERIKKLNMPVYLDDIISVARGSSLSIHDEKNKSVKVFGVCPGNALKSLLNRRKSNFLARVISVLKGADESERAYVSYKGDNPLPEFLYAAHQDSYLPAYKVDFKIVDNVTGAEVGEEMSDGQQVHFLVENKEEFPLCIGILWQDSDGVFYNCIEGDNPFCMIPAEGTLDLIQYPVSVGPPFGKDKIMLFASRDFFDLVAYPESNAVYRASERPGIQIGFVKKVFRVR